MTSDILKRKGYDGLLNLTSGCPQTTTEPHVSTRFFQKGYNFEEPSLNPKPLLGGGYVGQVHQ